MTEQQLLSLKDNAKLFYMIKGHLNTTIDTVNSCSNSYLKRCWYNEESYIYEEGFEQAYQQFIYKNKSKLGNEIANHIMNRVFKH